MLTDLRGIVQRETLDGEEIIWYGQPKAKFITGEGIVVFIFGAIFTAFSLFWTLSQIGPSSPFNDPFFRTSLIERIFPYFSLPFFLIGLWMLGGPFWIYRKAQRTLYAITNKRCLIMVLGRTKKIKSYDIDEIPNIDKTEYSDGSGNIIFAKEVHVGMRDDNGRRRVSTEKIGFYRIENVREVEKKLRAIWGR